MRATLRANELKCSRCAVHIENEIKKKDLAKEIVIDVPSGIISVDTEEDKLLEIKRLLSQIGIYHEEHEERQERILTFIGLGVFIFGWITFEFNAPVGFTLLVISSAINGYPRLRELWGNISTKSLDVFDENLLMLLGSIGGFVAGAYVEAAMVFNLYAIAELLEEAVKENAQKGLRTLLSDIPDSAILVKDNAIATVSVQALKVGDQIRLSAGDTLPVDAILLSDAVVDESVISGESEPINCVAGTLILSGSKLLTPSDARVVRPVEESNLSQVQKTIAQTLGQKSSFRTWMERFTSVYSPLVLASAVAVLIYGLAIGDTFSTAIYRTSVLLLISCPCSLLLASPSAVSAAVATLANSGLLVRNTSALEKMPKVETIVFDKTGTITTGRMNIIDSNLDDYQFSLVASVESYFKHPVAEAIVRHAADKGITLHEAVTKQNGNMLSGVVDGHQVEMVMEDVLNVKIDGKNAGYLKLEEEIRPEAKNVITSLKKQGYNLIILSGDREEKVKSLAQRVGIDTFYAEMTPEGKASFINNMEKHSHCLMVGDGLNDAVALSKAYVSAALPDRQIKTVVETSDFVLMGNLSPITMLRPYSTAYNSTVKTNVVLSLGIKIAVFALSLLGYVALSLAVVADEGTALLVLLNSFRLTKKA
ncbi:heavy metal translocating P-type ATPase [Coprothermobacter platensis]|uniref:heavy metal translocating P-type ATPase n=1 Tax=Coprothermobacter platensis TaxID=108819 RepID=UPI00036E858A|nr:heavy metal translocating P-type ATPase [Coprothermobacter platensis]